MSVRVVARIRPLLKSELDKDSIVEPVHTVDGSRPTTLKLPNPKNASESYSFNFNSVYDQDASQQDLFDNEISPTVKHLFGGYDVTIFAYGVTGTGKTHTMRGGKSLQDRGVIPRLLSAIYRRGRKQEKDSEGNKRVQVTMSYYEIYNDKVFDLFETPDKRTPTGLPIRDNNGKTVVAGLTERPCTNLKEFEQLYDQANLNRSTGATKLNAHSSRSHAILCVKITQHHPDCIISSTMSAIDLAGSEDNRRTGNAKEALVESSSINKSLFVLAQCVEAISKKQARIPYRESKMTRILSLGQNNGITVMILNLAPVRSYHLDTLSSLNFANRTKKIELREVENEPIFRGVQVSAGKAVTSAAGPGATSKRQPLRPLSSAVNIGLKSSNSTTTTDKPVKAFSVFAERANKRASTELGPGSLKRLSVSMKSQSRTAKVQRTDSVTRPSFAQGSRLPHHQRLGSMAAEPTLSRAGIEALVQRMVDEKLANRAMTEPVTAVPTVLSEEVQRRLEALEQRVEAKTAAHSAADDGRAEGLQFLLMAKQHAAHGEDASALRMYQFAQPFFPENVKLQAKIVTLRERLETSKKERDSSGAATQDDTARRRRRVSDEDYNGGAGDADEADYDDDYSQSMSKAAKERSKTSRAPKVEVFVDAALEPQTEPATPRTQTLLRIINSRDIGQIRQLKGVGVKKAEAIVSSLAGLDDELAGMEELEARLKGVGRKGFEVMRLGLGLGPGEGMAV